MKWLAYIFSIYILVLTVIPCCEGEQTHEEEALSTTHKQHNQPLEELEVCSPFFGCHCCVGFTLSFDTITLSQATALAAPQAVFHPIAPYFIPLGIWQPPKVA